MVVYVGSGNWDYNEVLAKAEEGKRCYVFEVGFWGVGDGFLLGKGPSRPFVLIVVRLDVCTYCAYTKYLSAYLFTSKQLRI